MVHVDLNWRTVFMSTLVSIIGTMITSMIINHRDQKQQ